MRTYYVPTKCGRCIECRQQRQREWIVRLSEELRENNNALFVTLTFDNKIIQEIKGIDENDKATKAMRLFLERCRKLTKNHQNTGAVQNWEKKMEEYIFTAYFGAKKN